MEKIKILIVDDSAFMRKVITETLGEEKEIYEVIGYARNGKEAVEKVIEYSPDVVTMDIEMPIMDGLEAIENIMNVKPTPCTIISTHAHENSEKAIKAMQLGAINLFPKDKLNEKEENKRELKRKIKEAYLSKIRIKILREKRKIEMQDIKREKNIDLVIIGSSTGGPKALSEIITNLPYNFKTPILIAQHMSDGFTKPLAERFDTLTHLNVKEVERGDQIEERGVYIAPAGYQTTIQKRSEKYYLNVSKDYSEETLNRPSIDKTILSATEHFGKNLLIAILTGMGEDGTKGSQEASKNGTIIIAESEETSIVYGMPKSVIDKGLAKAQYPIYKMAEIINKICE